MKKKAVLKVLAMLLVFIMTSSNVLAATSVPDTVALEETGSMTSKIIVKDGEQSVDVTDSSFTVDVPTKVEGNASISVSGYSVIGSSNVYVKETLKKLFDFGITGNKLTVTIKATENCSIGSNDILVNVSGENGTAWGKTINVTFVAANPTGWVKENGSWYYYENGRIKIGWIKVNDKWYYTNDKGIMQTGWTQVNDKWYYMNNEGVMQTGWTQVNGEWYCMNNEGVMQTGWIKRGDGQYYLQENGQMVHNCTLQIDGNYYDFDSTGLCTTPEGYTKIEKVDTVIDNIISEIGSVEAADPAVAEKIYEKVEEMIEEVGGIEDLAEILATPEADNIRDNYEELDKAAATAKDIKDINQTTNDNNKSTKVKGNVKVSGLALSEIENKDTVGLVITDIENKTYSSSEEKALLGIDNSKTVKKQVPLSIELSGIKTLKAPVVITIPVPTGIGKGFVLLHYAKSGVVKVDYILSEDGKEITFTVSGFSEFAFVEVGKKTTSRPSRPVNGSGASSSSTVVNNIVNPSISLVQSAASLRIRLANGTYVANQWQKINNKWYFADENAFAAKGWKMINAKWYYLDPTEGSMAEGWKMIDGKWYYLNPSDGDMATGWKMVDGKWYYLNPANGDCLINTTTPDGYRVDENGAWVQ